MSYQKERDEFIGRFVSLTAPALGQYPAICLARTLLHKASTLQRLAEAQCNGDWPYDNGERKTVVCPRCEWSVHPSDIKRGLCTDCRVSEAVAKALTGSGYKPYIQGDPRGAVLRLMPLAALDADIECGRERGIYVPARG
jgi:hypothetical protein